MKKRQYGVKKSSTLIKEIPHLIQGDNWDCGLACLKMVMRYLHPLKTDDDLSKACKDHKLGQSVWTIDLAYLCCYLGMKYRFCTQTLGVKSDYANEAFYKNEMRRNFSDEETRVNELFSRASEGSIKVEKASVDIGEILQHVESGQPVIVLINDKEFKRKKACSKPSNQSCWTICCLQYCCCFGSRKNGYTDVESQNRQTQAGPTDESYWGHYVVAIGYDLERRVVIFNDPSRGGEHIDCDFETFDRARKSFGTDEDILFIFSS